MTALAPAAAVLVGFGGVLRQAGFAIAPEQNVCFLDAVRLLGPGAMGDIRRAALATLAPAPERRGDFDALFQSYFWGDSDLIATRSDEDEEIKDDAARDLNTPLDILPDTGGALATSQHQLAVRQFDPARADLAGFQRALATALPTRRSLRPVPSRSRGRPDLRRSLRDAVRTDGDIAVLRLRDRPRVQRPIVMLIDISGSMKTHTQDHLKLAHAVVQGATRAEIFTLGTRLTRITPALRLRQRTRALNRAAQVVEDWDGGTRIGPTLLSFLSVPRFAAMARGACVVILSDGLERGDPSEMETAFRRLAGRAHRLSLCTPLAADPRFRPETAALCAVLPVLDDLVDGGSPGRLASFILSLAHPAPAARDVWGNVNNTR